MKMRKYVITSALLALTAAMAWAGQPTSNDFLPVAKLKKFTNFLGYDRDKDGVGDLQTALQNSGTNWHCTSDAYQLKCPLRGDTGLTGTNVSFRAPHADEGGAQVSDFRVMLLNDDTAALTQLQPTSPAAALLDQDWASVTFDLGKPTNSYDDGSAVRYVYCAAGEINGKPGEARTVRVYAMFLHVTRVTNKVTAVELATVDQVLKGDSKPSC